MITIQVCKAQKIDNPIESVIILIDREIRPLPLDEQGGFCQGEANQLEEILLKVLPGATYDRLFARMSWRKASLLSVSLSE